MGAWLLLNLPGVHFDSAWKIFEPWSSIGRKTISRVSPAGYSRVTLLCRGKRVVYELRKLDAIGTGLPRS